MWVNEDGGEVHEVLPNRGGCADRDWPVWNTGPWERAVTLHFPITHNPRLRNAGIEATIPLSAIGSSRITQTGVHRCSTLSLDQLRALLSRAGWTSCVLISCLLVAYASAASPRPTRNERTINVPRLPTSQSSDELACARYLASCKPSCTACDRWD